jgi:hypothetical protein
MLSEPCKAIVPKEPSVPSRVWALQIIPLTIYCIEIQVNFL